MSSPCSSSAIYGIEHVRPKVVVRKGQQCQTSFSSTLNITILLIALSPFLQKSYLPFTILKYCLPMHHQDMLIPVILGFHILDRITFAAKLHFECKHQLLFVPTVVLQ